MAKATASSNNASRGNKRGTVRQRKKSSTATDNDDDEDQLLRDAIQSTVSSKSVIPIFPILLAGIAIVAAIALVSPFGISNSQQQQSGPPGTPSTSTKTAKANTKSRRAAQESTTTSTTISSPPSPPTTAKIIRNFKVLKTLPHDPKAFTQGLTFRPDNSSILYEATGNYEESEVRVLNLENGEILQSYKTPGQYFGEGLNYMPPPPTPKPNDDNKNDEENSDQKGQNNTIKGRLIHLTWREQTGFVFDIDTLDVLDTFSYDSLTTNEGWGIIHVPSSSSSEDGDGEFDDVGTQFIVSDGSANLHFWNAQYQNTKPKIEVTFQTEEMVARDLPPKAAMHLNELEWDAKTQTVLANVWYQDLILRIDPHTGIVTTIYDTSSLYTDRLQSADCFNGIALSAEGGLWVTGKNWPHLYQIELGES